MKYGRNDLCWCGSGKKYKRCHLDKDKAPTISRENIEKYSKKIKSKKNCSVSELFPEECHGRIVRAYSISKSGSLKLIAEDGHVIGVSTSFHELKKNDSFGLKSIGINEASTFTGFCKKHDMEIFSCLENEEITLTNQQLFLLAYRGLCREIFFKENNKSVLLEMMPEIDSGRPEFVQPIIREEAKKFLAGTELALNNLNHLKCKMDGILISSKFEKVNYCLFELSELPKLLVSSAIIPEVDFKGNRLQFFTNKQSRYSYISFNCIAYENRGCFVFSWLDDNGGHCKRFIDSLLEYDDSEIGDALVRLCYCFTENSFASPSWWNSLNKEQRDFILYMLNCQPNDEINNKCLASNGMRFDALQVSRRELRYY